MQGSLIDPPIKIVGSRWKAGLSLAVLVPVTLVSVLPLVAGLVEIDNHSRRSIGATANLGMIILGASLTAFLGALAYRAAYLTIRPPVMTISPSGLSIDLAGRENSWTWSQVSNLRYKSGRGRGLVFGEQSWKGSHRGIGPIWEIGLDQIQTLLTEGKAKWGRSSTIIVAGEEPTPPLAQLSWIALAGMVCGVLLLQTSHRHAHATSYPSSEAGPRFGAISMSDDLQYGQSWRYKTAAAATSRAMAECQNRSDATNCRIRAVVEDQCLAAVKAGDRAYLAQAPRAPDALAAAQQECAAASTTACIVVTQICASDPP